MSNKVVDSDTDPRLKLRRMEIRFISQEINGTKMGHDAVLFIPIEPKRHDKVVIVARNYYDDTLIGNCAEPIAARTGYPTMCVVIPGDQDGKNGEMPWLTGLRKLARDTHDPMNHDLFRCAIPYLRALDVFSDVLKTKKIRAIIGGHSKRAYYAYTAAAIDPERIAGVVYLGCERLFSEEEKRPDFSVSPPFAPGEKYPKSLVLFTTQKYVKCPVLYLGATNEAGFTMFNINKLTARMKDRWTIEYIPNYRHASRSEKQFIDWQMWVSHIFDGRPLTKISEVRVEKTKKGTILRAKIDSKNKIIQVKAWHVHCDDAPYWRDLMWYPALMRKKEGNLYEARIGGNRPDAWFVEVKDIANGFPGYVSSLPQNITGKPAAERNARRPRYWKATDKNDVDRILTSTPEAYRHFLDGQKYRREGNRSKAITAYQKAIELDPQFAIAYWEMGMTFSQRHLSSYGKKSKALKKALTLSDRLSPRDRYVLQGDYYSMTRYHYDRAIKAYKNLLQLCPNDIEGHQGLGKIYFDIEQWEKAASEFRFVVQADPKQTTAYINLARAYLNPGLYDEAEKTLKTCLKQTGDNLQANLLLARIYQHRDQYDLAHKIIEPQIARHPNVASCYAAQGDIYLYSDNLQKAEAVYQKLFDDPRPEFHRLGLYRLSELRLLQGKLQSARTLAQKGFELAQKFESKNMMRDRLSLLATLDALTGHSAEAIEKWDLLWKTTLEDQELEWQRFVVYSKGLVYAETGQTDQAMQEAKTLENLVGKGIDQKKQRLSLHLMGLIELKRKNYAKAIAYLEKCLPMISTRSRLNMPVVDTLALAYLKTGNLEKAQKEYAHIATFPRGRQFYGNLYALSFYHLGQIHEAQGEKEKAKKSYQKFLTLWHNADPTVLETWPQLPPTSR
ncbi:MAG: tetratricopeptide repeat protein [Planctomycetia bacterium]